MTPPVPSTDAVQDLPFTSKISLTPLLRAWQTGCSCHPLFDRFAEQVLALRDRHPELFEPSADVGRFRDAEELVKLLLTPVLSCASDRHNLVAVARPFRYEFLYATEGFRELLLDAEGRLRAQPKTGGEVMAASKQLAVYVQIARQCYDIDIAFDPNPTFVVSDGETGLNRYFQFHFDSQFLQVVCTGRAKKLSAQKIDQLRQNLRDVGLWRRTLPPEDYEMQGVVLIHATDITAREAITDIQQAFATGTPLVSREGIRLLTRSARDIFRRNSLSVRLLYAQHGRAFMVGPDAGGCAGCLISNSRRFEYRDFAGSIYERAKQAGSVFVKDARSELDPDNVIHRVLLDDGVRSLMVFPLRENGEFVGMLELDFGTTEVEPGDIALKVGDLLAITTLGLKQGRQLLEQNVRSVIQQKTSVVHPAVEWKFRRAAFEAIAGDGDGEIGRIVFPDVYPLFSQADIKDSSAYRNDAIRADLGAQFQLARAVLISAQRAQDMPLLAELDFQIETYLNDLSTGLRSGDELSMSQFFKNELEPILPRLAELGGDVHSAVEHYRARLHPRFGVLHEKRSEYEQSVRQINEAIDKLLDDEEQHAQKVFPHYVEKTFTDGAELMIYVGASLIEDGRFNPFYLRNLRLWQLRVSCQIARLCEALRPELKVPLQTTHLVLVQDAPLSISFSETERNFVVDGAYNIRYEIMKKRIDKATVGDGGERLTQPGKIAVVYSHDAEAQEYRRYIRFLQHQGWLAEQVEDLELQTLQGLQGLRALRVSVELSGEIHRQPPAQPEQALAGGRAAQLLSSAAKGLEG